MAPFFTGCEGDIEFRRVMEAHFAWGTEDQQVQITGQDRKFRCECGANVFKQHRSENRFKCNGCGATYAGEAM